MYKCTHVKQSPKLAIKSARCNSFNYSFFIRTVREWTSLPRSVVEAETVNNSRQDLKVFSTYKLVYTYKVYLGLYIVILLFRKGIFSFLFLFIFLFVGKRYRVKIMFFLFKMYFLYIFLSHLE